MLPIYAASSACPNQLLTSGASVGIAVDWNAKMKFADHIPTQIATKRAVEMVSRRGATRGICLVVVDPERADLFIRIPEDESGRDSNGDVSVGCKVDAAWMIMADMAVRSRLRRYCGAVQDGQNMYKSGLKGRKRRGEVGFAC